MQKHDSPSCAFLQLAGPAVDANAFYSPKFRAFPVQGTAMAPTLSIGDFAMVLPVSEFRGEGVYLVDQGNGVAILYRVHLWERD